MVKTHFPKIERATRIVAEERERTVAEERALRLFRSEIEDLEPTASPKGNGQLLTDERTITAKRFHSGSGPGSLSSTQQRVVEAYRGTVMELDHYQEEYGNGVVEDIAIEFDGRIAYALFETETLPTMVYRLLLTATDRSIRDRETYLRSLDAERDSLEACSATLTDIADRFNDLTAAGATVASEELADLERRCRHVLERRQEVLHSRSKPALRGVDDTALNNYLYGQRMTVTCPVLHDAVSLWRDVHGRRTEKCSN